MRQPVWFTIILWVSVLGTVFYVPFLDWLVTPFDKIATFVHELGHTLVCLGTGGYVSLIDVAHEGGGVTHCHGGIRFFYVQAGYLAAPLVAALLIPIMTNVHLAKRTLMCSGAILAATGMVYSKTEVANGWSTTLACALVWLGMRCQPTTAWYCVRLLWWQFLFAGMRDLRILLKVVSSHEKTNDAARMEQLTGIPATVWIIIWVLLSICMLALSSYLTRKFLRAPDRAQQIEANESDPLKQWQKSRPKQMAPSLCKYSRFSPERIPNDLVREARF